MTSSWLRPVTAGDCKRKTGEDGSGLQRGDRIPGMLHFQASFTKCASTSMLFLYLAGLETKKHPVVYNRFIHLQQQLRSFWDKGFT